MATDQNDLLKLARKLGDLERQAAKAKLAWEALVERGNKARELIFANLAATGSPQERENELVRLLAQSAERPRLRVSGVNKGGRRSAGV